MNNERKLFLKNIFQDMIKTKTAREGKACVMWTANASI